MGRISGIFFLGPTSQLRAFESLQSELNDAFRKVSPHLNAYFHVDDRSQYATRTPSEDGLKTERHIVWSGALHNNVSLIINF